MATHQEARIQNQATELPPECHINANIRSQAFETVRKDTAYFGRADAADSGNVGAICGNSGDEANLLLWLTTAIAHSNLFELLLSLQTELPGHLIEVFGI